MRATAIFQNMKNLESLESYADILRELATLQANLIDHQGGKEFSWEDSEARTPLSYIVFNSLPVPFRKELENYSPGHFGGISVYKIFKYMHKCVRNIESKNVKNSSSNDSNDQIKHSDSSLSTNSVVMSSSASPEGNFKHCVFCKSTIHA